MSTHTQAYFFAFLFCLLRFFSPRATSGTLHLDLVYFVIVDFCYTCMAKSTNQTPSPLVLSLVLSSNPFSPALSSPTQDLDSSAPLLIKVLAGVLTPRRRFRRAWRRGLARRLDLRLGTWGLHGVLRFRVSLRCAADGIFPARRPSRPGLRAVRPQDQVVSCTRPSISNTWWRNFVDIITMIPIGFLKRPDVGVFTEGLPGIYDSSCLASHEGQAPPRTCAVWPAFPALAAGTLVKTKPELGT